VHSLGNVLNGLEDYLNDHGVYVHVDIVFDEEVLSDSDDIEDVPENTNEHTRHKDVTLRQRQQIYEALLENSNNGKLKKGSTTVVANMFNVSLRTVQCVWHRAKGCRHRGEPVDVSSKKPKHYVKKKIHLPCQELLQFPYTGGAQYEN
jgi:hypothetical protein